MALVGAGNTLGGTPAGVGASLNYIGDHVYANSGEVAVNQNLTELFNFTTGSNQYIVADIIMGSEGASGNDFFIESKLNGEVVFVTFMSTDTTPYPTVSNPLRILVPPNSTFVFALKNDSAATRTWTATLVGRVYA